MENIEHIQLIPAREQVVAVLRRAILTKELKPGHVIILSEMAEMMGVSSTPVREALQQLSFEGLIQLRPNKRAIVLKITCKHVKDFYETLNILEREAAGLACRSDNTDELTRAFLAEGEIVRQGKIEDYETYHRAFHRAIREMTGNDKLISILSGLWVNSSGSLLSTTLEYARTSHDEHEKIYHAICQHDVEQAKHYMEAHIMRNLNDVMAMSDFED